MKGFIQQKLLRKEGGGGGRGRKGMSASLLKISAALKVLKRHSQFHHGESKRPKSTLHFKVTEEPYKYTRYSTRKLGLFYINKLSVHLANRKAQTSLSGVKKGESRDDREGFPTAQVGAIDGGIEKAPAPDGCVCHQHRVEGRGPREAPPTEELAARSCSLW